jgi:prevent-host-death family protein
MGSIGVRELREKTAEVLRQVREEGAEYVITYQGRPIAVLLPVNTEAVEAAMLDASKQSAKAWDNFFRIAEEIRKIWPADVKTQDLIDEIRGD